MFFFRAVLLHVSYYSSCKQAKEQIIKHKQKLNKEKIKKIRRERERGRESDKGVKES